LLQTFYGPNPHACAQFGFSLAAVDAHSFVAGAPGAGHPAESGAAYLIKVAPLVTVAAAVVATANFPVVPQPRGAVIQAFEGSSTGTQTVATSASPAAYYQDLPISATIDWGDGATDDASIVLDPDTRLFQVQGHHTYREEGNYPITVAIEQLYRRL